jgi:hypothetical protein
MYVQSVIGEQSFIHYYTLNKVSFYYTTFYKTIMKSENRKPAITSTKCIELNGCGLFLIH